MSTVFCKKYEAELPAMEKPPFPNELGRRLHAEYSQKAWDQWVALQTMLINEKHLSLFEPEAKQFLSEQRELFLSGGDYEKPSGFTPEH